MFDQRKISRWHGLLPAAERTELGAVEPSRRPLASPAVRRTAGEWRTCRLAAIAALLLACSLSSWGVIFLSTGDPEHNTTPPNGELSGSGWETQGMWGGFLGTAIAPKYFITAKHLGGVVGGKFVLNGVAYTTSAFFDDPETDLRIWRIRERFPAYAELYPHGDEPGHPITVFGRGTQRGDEVMSAGLFGASVRGWHWGANDGRQRWGENRVDGFANDGRNGSGGGVLGEERASLLRVPFDTRGGANEAHLSIGDSGGGVFIRDGAMWKLAGVNYVVDGPYNTHGSGPGFHAAIFDERGLYKGGEGRWTRVNGAFGEVPGAFYATRISTRLGWIQGVLSDPSPPEAPLVFSSLEVLGPYSNEPDATFDLVSKTIFLPRPSSIGYYRLNGPRQLRIAEILPDAARLILRYE